MLLEQLLDCCSDFLLKIGFVAVEGTSQAALFIENDKHGAVNEKVFGSGLLLRLLFLGNQLETIHSHFNYLALHSRDKPPTVRVSPEAGSVLLENGGRVVTGIGGQSKEAYRGIAREAFLEGAHLSRHFRARAHTAGENDVSQGDRANQ